MEQRSFAHYLPWVLIIVLILIAGFFFYHHSNSNQYTSTLTLNPTQAVSVAVTPTLAPEPFVTNWTQYSNDQFHFSIDIPQGWNEQQYSSSFPRGGTIIAFSPNSL